MMMMMVVVVMMMTIMMTMMMIYVPKYVIAGLTSIKCVQILYP